jgi:UDP-2,3-diacylglucosamine pyrophosphatase LpxH
MGISPLAAADLLRATGADVLVCGHVHWGRTYALEVDARERRVVVLGAWDGGDPSFVRFDGRNVAFERVP